VTTLVAGWQARRAGRWRPPPSARLTWAAWRQHRGLLIGLAVFVAVLGAYTVVDGLWVQGISDPLGCGGPGVSAQCWVVLNGHFYAVWFSGILVPLAIGVFVGAPLLAREYADGTARFAWTQGVGRTRPLLAKLILLALAALTAGAVLGGLARWAALPTAGQEPTVVNGWYPPLFSSSPVAEAAAAVLCFAAGVLAGVLTRRVVPAMVATAAVVVGGTVADYGRLYYWMLGLGQRRGTEPALGASQLTAQAANPHAPGGRFSLHEAVGRDPFYLPAVRWLDQGWYTNAAGQPLRGAALTRVLTHPGRLTQLHDTFSVTYQPVSRYWLFQSVQGGAELLLALLLGALAVWLVQRRKA
jgi:hypothetical protein